MKTTIVKGLEITMWSLYLVAFATVQNKESMVYATLGMSLACVISYNIHTGWQRIVIITFNAVLIFFTLYKLLT